MSYWSDAWSEFKREISPPPPGAKMVTPGDIAAAVGTAAAAAGAAAGATSTAPGALSPGQAALNQLRKGPAVETGEAIKESVQGIFGAGPLAHLQTAVVWTIIILIALIGVWGLIAPGGGVALIERKISGR